MGSSGSKASSAPVSDSAGVRPPEPEPEPAASEPRPAVQPEAELKGYVPGQSITERFKYDPIVPPKPEELAAQDALHNNCILRSLMSGAAGGAMGIAFGIFMGAMDPGALSGPAPLAEKQRSAMQVLRETFRTTKARSVYAFTSPSSHTDCASIDDQSCAVESMHPCTAAPMLVS